MDFVKGKGVYMDSVGGKVVFEWTVPANYKNFTGHDDIPEAYLIIENERAVGGIVIYTKYQGKWSVQTGSLRPLIKHLIEKLGQMEEK